MELLLKKAESPGDECPLSSTSDRIPLRRHPAKRIGELSIHQTGSQFHCKASNDGFSSMECGGLGAC